MEGARIEFLADRPALAPVLAAWHAEAWARLYPGMTAATAARDLLSHTGRGQVPTTLVALLGSDPAGCVSLIEDDLPGCIRYNPWVASLYVRADLRGRGIGAALLVRICEVADALGLQESFLFTEAQAPFFRRRGWSDVGPSACNGHPVTILRRRLRSAPA
jgi:GNAT superfamily N-acetyltransferase